MSVEYRGIPDTFDAVQALPKDITYEFFSAGNGAAANTITVPANMNYMLVKALVGAGGAGGGGDGGTGTSATIGGGSGAYMKNVWVYVNPGDVITFNIGNGGIGLFPSYASLGTTNQANPGGPSLITIKSGTQTNILFSVGGGNGGCGSFETNMDSTVIGIGGESITNRTAPVVNGTNAAWNNTVTHPNGPNSYHSDANPGANSPWGAGGNNGSKNGINADGYGAGGGSASYLNNTSGNSTGQAFGGTGSDGYAKVILTAFTPQAGTPVFSVNNSTGAKATTNSVAPRLVGRVYAKDLYEVQTFFNNNYPDLAFSYQPGIIASQLVLASDINNFISALASCDTGWQGSYACPTQTTYNVGELITEVQFLMPKPNFIPVLGREYYYTGNGTDTNTFRVPAGCRYMNLHWIIGGGGGGGGASGFHGTSGLSATGAGSAAWAKDVWIEVKFGDIIYFQVGQNGYGGGYGAYGYDGSDGGASKISIYRTGLNQTFTIFDVTGGGHGGNNENGSGYTQLGYGGVVNAALGNNYGVGNHCYWDRGSNAGVGNGNGDYGRPGADSPLGKGGAAGGFNEDCNGCNPAGHGTGYGAGGGGGGYFDDNDP